MDFQLTEEQQMVRDMARKFAEVEIKPKAAELDDRHEHPAEIVRQLGELKMLGIAVPEEYGGGGMDNVSYALALMEVSKGCASTGAIMSVNNSLYCFPVMAYGTHEQKMKYLTPCASGEKIGCYGLTEANAGSDPASMRTTAVKDGDEWVINGEKKFITNGNVSSYCVTAAVTEKGKGYKGISSFVMDLENTPGFEVGRVEEKMGISSYRHHKIKTLSLGNRCRTSIAQALIGKPDFIILDEPFSNLDAGGVDDLLTLINELNGKEGITFLLASHQLPYLEQICSHVSILHEGDIALSIKLEEFINHEPTHAILYTNGGEKAFDTLSKIPGITICNSHCNDGILVELDGITTAQLNKELTRRDVDVYELIRQRPSLDSLFRKVTGSSTNA